MSLSQPVRAEGEILWRPSKERVAGSRLASFAQAVRDLHQVEAPDYEALWRWSIDDLEQFWAGVWNYFEVGEAVGPEVVLETQEMPGARWFPGHSLNYAEYALGHVAPARDVIVSIAEDGTRRATTGAELRRQVAAFAAFLRAAGVGVGDRVAAYLPNIEEAVVALLGTAAVGAIWSSCSPDFGERAVLDRFQQIEPKVLVVVDGYRYAGRTYDRREVGARLLAGLPSVHRVVMAARAFDGDGWLPNATSWSHVMRSESDLEFTRVPFSHPLWIVYSSGTTGLPKPIVHSQGGILLEHLKVLGLHADLGEGSRFFWFTTTGWMMWNYLVGGLLVGAAVVLYDGAPGWPDPGRLWRLIADERLTHFGTSAGHIAASMKAGVRPAGELDLGSLQFVGSTGSPLSPQGFGWVYEAVKDDVWLSSLSGGTDLCTAFLVGCPWLPVRAGVIQCRALGAGVEAFDQQGLSVIEEVGELVITRPMPSMPLFLWGDREMERYRASYFEHYPGVWRHGDWIKVRSDGGAVIYGRSDSTINRHGVRMGTAEIYRAVEDMAAVRDSLVVEVTRPDGTSYMPLFVVLEEGAELDDALVAEVRATVRRQVSPRHVPDLVIQVPEIPKTLSGKKLEVPIKRILQGEAAGATMSIEAVQNPESLAPFLALAARTAGT